MPGVKIVEEPSSDLWFPPDQCVVPAEAYRELDQAGYWGLGEYYDPAPWQSLGAALSQGGPRAPFDPISSIRQARTMEEFELSPEVEQEIQRQQQKEWSWRSKLPPVYRHAPEHVIRDIEAKVMYLSVNPKTAYSFNIRIQPYRGIIAPAFELEQESEALPTGYPRRIRSHESEPGTCVPTRWCMTHCYAKVGKFVTYDEQHWYMLSKQQARYLQNLIVSHMYERSSESEITQQADAFYESVRERWYTASGARTRSLPEDAPMNLRLNGSGDFNRGTIRLFNRLAERHPDLVLWGFTRKRTSAPPEGLIPRANLRILVSLDPSTPYAGEARGFDLADLCETAHRLGGDMSFATGLRDYPAIDGFRKEIDRLYGDDLMIATVFGYHCGSIHTSLGDVMECSATDPRMYGGCQECRWCMMDRKEKMEEGVRTPNQAFWLHGGLPDLERIDKDNAKIREWNATHPGDQRELIEPYTEDEVWDV